MSTLKVNTINASTSGQAVDVDIKNPKTFRRLTINGDMKIAQRGTSATTDGYGSVDRFRQAYSGTDEAPTQSQVDVASGTTPYTSGFRKAFKITNGNQTSGAGTSDLVLMRHKLEAQDIASSGWNYTSSSSFITLSFWCKSSVAQNFYIRLETSDGTAQAYYMETGSLTADTWTKVTKTIPGNSNLQFDNDANVGLTIEWVQFYGTDKTGSVSLDSWAAYSDTLRVPDMTSTWYTTNDATWELTGVQLEVGSVATDFEFRTVAQEFELCKRYLQDFQGGDGDYVLALANTWTSTQPRFILYFSPEMRAAPTFTTPVGGYKFRNASGATQNDTGTSASASDINTKMAVITGSQPQGGLNAGNVGQVRLVTGSNTPGIARFDAEL